MPVLSLCFPWGRLRPTATPEILRHCVQNHPPCLPSAGLEPIAVPANAVTQHLSKHKILRKGTFVFCAKPGMHQTLVPKRTESVSAVSSPDAHCSAWSDTAFERIFLVSLQFINSATPQSRECLCPFRSSVARCGACQCCETSFRQNKLTRVETLRPLWRLPIASRKKKVYTTTVETLLFLFFVV